VVAAAAAPVNEGLVQKSNTEYHVDSPFISLLLLDLGVVRVLPLNCSWRIKDAHSLETTLDEFISLTLPSESTRCLCSGVLLDMRDKVQDSPGCFLDSIAVVTCDHVFSDFISKCHDSSSDPMLCLIGGVHYCHYHIMLVIIIFLCD